MVSGQLHVSSYILTIGSLNIFLLSRERDILLLCLYLAMCMCIVKRGGLKVSKQKLTADTSNQGTNTVIGKSRYGIEESA